MAELRDQADAQLLSDVAAALHRWEQSTGVKPPLKVLRETVWFFWQHPRLKVGGDLIASKYPRSARWSREAAALAVGGVESWTGHLVIEHIRPLHRVVRQMIEDPPQADQVEELLAPALEVVVITKDQERALPDKGEPEQRYVAAGLDLAAFKSLDEWEEAFAAQRLRPDYLEDVKPGDAVFDFRGRPWAVVAVGDDGLTLRDPQGGENEYGWHALLTIGIRPQPYPPRPTADE